MKRGALLILVFLLIGTIPIIVAQGDKAAPTSVVESVTLESNGSDISWTSSETSTKGFKVVWSKTETPTYPTRTGDKYHYFSDPNKKSDTLTAFDGEGTYYVRVCEYLSGACGTYSNQIEIQFGKEEAEKGINPTEESGPIDIPTEKEEIVCNGCITEDICYPIGYRKDGMFCSGSLEFTNQSESEDVCENNFECESNVCVSGECIDQGFIKKIISWFKHLF